MSGYSVRGSVAEAECITNVIVSSHFLKPMINLDERYHNYLTNPQKKFRIDGVGERVTGYGYHCEGGDIAGHYVTTDNYKLFYNKQEQFVRMEALKKVVIEA